MSAFLWKSSYTCLKMAIFKQLNVQDELCTVGGCGQGYYSRAVNTTEQATLRGHYSRAATYQGNTVFRLEVPVYGIVGLCRYVVPTNVTAHIMLMCAQLTKEQCLCTSDTPSKSFARVN